MPAPLTQQDVLLRFRQAHGDRYDYSLVKYTRVHEPVKIICGDHGVFTQSPAAHMFSKQGCPRCGRERAGARKSLSFDEWVTRSRRVHGDQYGYDQRFYKSLNEPACIFCNAHQHFFTQLPAVHITGATGCKECASEKHRQANLKKRISRATFCRRARAAHGTRYDYSALPANIFAKQIVTLACKTHGEFQQQASRHMQGAGCPRCAGNARHTIERIKQIAKSRGGRCLSQDYTHRNQAMQWQCKEGHKWYASVDRVIGQGKWCPECMHGLRLGEEIVRAHLEAMFEKPFPRCRPRWLKGLELDGFNPDLAIAFEHQGQQHYFLKPHFHGDPTGFADQKRRDERKRRYCRDKGVTLIEVPSVPDMTTIERLRTLLDEAVSRTPHAPLILASQVRLTSGDVVARQSMIRLLRRTARERKGKLLSKAYLGSTVRHTWECDVGHVWEAVPSSVLKGGTWCPDCAGTKPLSLQQMQTLAVERGGCCLSRSYRNAHTPLRWRCGLGHEWQASANSVKYAQSWCPICVGHRKTISVAKDKADALGGKCLSKHCESAASVLRWRCDKGHEWRESLARIIRGRWCPVCRPLRRVTIARLKRWASDNGGKCLSASYDGPTAPLRWSCARGHEWKARAKNILNGSWCPKCAGNERKDIGAMQRLAQTHDGRCLSKRYRNMNSQLRWQCIRGHSWDATPAAVKRGHWCPTCAGNKRLSIKDMQRLAAEHGGECLSVKYTNARTRLRWKCAEGHIWEATPDPIRNRGAWCPICRCGRQPKCLRARVRTLTSTERVRVPERSTSKSPRKTGHIS